MRLSWQTVGGLTAAVLVGCAPLHRQQGQIRPGLGEILPQWAFDAPFYFRPPPDAVPKPRGQPQPDHPAHYYVNERAILIERPANNVPADRVPRIAVWWTNTDGCLWTRAGYFGLGQTHFAFIAGDDGDYGIRFVGPGIRESLFDETRPHRVYHLDTQPATVTVDVEPEVPVYDPDEVIWIRWTAQDINLDEKPVRLAVCWSWENPGIIEARRREAPGAQTAGQGEATSLLWHPFKPAFDREGVLAYTIPPYAAGEGLQLQVRAKDRAGNYGVGYSKPILVNGYTSWPPATQPAATVE